MNVTSDWREGLTAEQIRAREAMLALATARALNRPTKQKRRRWAKGCGGHGREPGRYRGWTNYRTLPFPEDAEVTVNRKEMMKLIDRATRTPQTKWQRPKK